MKKQSRKKLLSKPSNTSHLAFPEAVELVELSADSDSPASLSALILTLDQRVHLWRSAFRMRLCEELNGLHQGLQGRQSCSNCAARASPLFAQPCIPQL